MMNRRTFLKAAGAASLIPLVQLPAFAADKVPLTDPAAIGLKYVEDAAQATRTDKMGVAAADQICGNCRFYIGDEPEWGPCQLFQNRLVTHGGWCAGWVPRPS
ncbi:MAG: high-potential iron-sulfur protein [Proteobacteria bacterium]|nr:high-potential iron-sulfur protein [Pseudomonadota bacterium]